MTKDEALKLALEALEYNQANWQGKDKAITAIKEALAQPEQEPVAWQGCDLDGMVEAFERVIEAHFFRKNPFHNPIDADAQMALRILRGFIPYMKQYTTPPQRTWVGLTDEELETMAEKYVTNCYFDTLEYARAIEAAHGIKENT